MRFLFKIEEVFEISGRGCVIVPAIEGTDFKIRARDAIQLRTPEGRTLNTHILAVELLKVAAGPCRIAIMLPPDVLTQDVAKEATCGSRNVNERNRDVTPNGAHHALRLPRGTLRGR